MTSPDTLVLPPEMADGAGSQTLDRGLRVLAVVCASRDPMTVPQIVAAVGLHRSICYRIVRTLVHHDLLERDDTGRYRAGGRLPVLAGRVEPHLQAVARPHLEVLAEASGMTAFLVTAHAGEAVTVMVVEPHGSLAHVSYRPGGRHPLTVGAPGLAILAGRPPTVGERREVGIARERGWSSSTSEVIEGYRSVAVPLPDPSGRCRHAVAVVFAGQVDEPVLAAEVVRAARDISARLG